MTWELVWDVLTTYNTLSGVLFAAGILVVLICILTNHSDSYDWYDEDKDNRHNWNDDDCWW